MLAIDYQSVDYIPYWLSRNEVSSLSSDITKTEIMDNHIKTQKQRRRNFVKKAKSLGEKEKKAAQALLSGKGMKRFEAFQKTNLETKIDTSAPESTQAALAIIEAGINKLDNANEFVTLLNNYLNTFSDYADGIFQSYAANLVEDMSNSRSKKVQQYDDVDSRIIEALLGRYNNDMFKINAKENNIPTTLAKIVSMANSLPAVIDSGQTFTVRHQGSNQETEISSDSPEFIEVAIDKAIAWLRELDKGLKEISLGLAKLKADKKVYEILQDVEHTFKHTATDYFEINFKPDPKQTEMLSAIKGGLTRATQKKMAKADFGIWIGEENVGAFMGVNAKNYSKSLNPNSSSASFKIQDETPMLTLLMREAHFSAGEIVNLIRLGAGHVNFADDDDLANENWNKLITQIKYRSVLSALAGLDNTVDQSYYMAIGGTFYKIEDVLANIRDYGGVTISAQKADSQKEIGQGLKREAYQKINRWIAAESQSPNIIDAEERSAMVHISAYRLMYETKLRVEIRLGEIAAFMKLGYLK